MHNLFVIYLILLVITTLFGLVYFQKLTGPFRLLALMTGYVFLAELLSRYFITLGFKNTFPLYHLSSVILIAFTAGIYLKLIQSNPLQRFVIFLSLICGLTAILNTLFIQEIFTFPSFSIAAHAFMSITLSLTVFNEMIKAPTQTHILKQSLFWLNCGTFLFYSANFVGFILYNEYYQIKGVTITWIFYLNWIGNMILYSCYLIGFYFNQKRS